MTHWKAIIYLEFFFLQDMRKIMAAGGSIFYGDTDSVIYSIEPEKLEALKDTLVCHDAVYGT